MDQPRAAWLDPCVGSGAFVAALAASGVPRRRITALDVDSRPSQHDRLAQTLRGVDFIRWASNSKARFDRVVLNPPYVPLTRLEHNGVRAAALALRYPDGLPLSPTANYWCAFLIACLRILKPGAGLCAVLPAAWDFAGYADRVRSTYRHSFSTLTVVRSSKPLFPVVRDGSIIIVARDFGGAPQRESRLEVHDVIEMTRVLAALPRRGRTRAQASRHRPGTERTCPLAGVASVRIGAVTGDATYFLLTEQQRSTLELPLAAVRPVLTRARHLRRTFATTSLWRSLLGQGERVWLFHPEDEVLEHPSVKRYLGLSLAGGGCDRGRYKVRDRDDWYRSKLPSRVDGFLSGMTHGGPALVLRRMRGLTASNTLYVFSFKERLSFEAKAGWAIALLTSTVREQLRDRTRRYPGGLSKLEPGDLHSLLLPEPSSMRDAIPTLVRATSLFFAGKHSAASAIADRWVHAPGR